MNHTLVLRINNLINRAINLVSKCQSEEDFEYIYDTIFNEIGQELVELGVKPDYYDPDTSYEEDIRAYVKALVEYRKRKTNLAS